MHSMNEHGRCGFYSHVHVQEHGPESLHEHSSPDATVIGSYACTTLADEHAHVV